MASHLLTQLRVRPGTAPDLTNRDTDETFGWDKVEAKAELEVVKQRLDALQVRLFAERTRSLLLVLQAADAAGKDGTIRSIFSGLNPAGVRVTSFKVPAGREVEQDYLWRVHAACPAKGEIGVFNRSHYEDVIVVRVHHIVPKAVWSKRYRHINEFERMLVDEGTTVVKCFLHVSEEEQRQRLQERIDNPEKRWKFRAGDLEDRAKWPAFQAAYADALTATSTSSAPWYVIPADRNWVRNLAVAKVLLDTLERLDPQLPAPDIGIEQITVV
ncbi:MAG: UDP-galactose-lipid carrier transferase [Ilumatobacteraceae bacterium]|jgi:PPK2 family polyphosphate:nucleotide phosphotransferase|nr:UDP-galactose-lipid carrier transferase [Ilumatobacteraceae bacterium]